MKVGNGPLINISVSSFAGQKIPATPWKKKPSFEGDGKLKAKITNWQN